MPAPRAAIARKSVVPDPDLYNNSDSDDDHDRLQPEHKQPPPAKRSRTSTTATGAGSTAKGLVRKGSKGPQPTRGSVTTETGRRRSTRLSNEHQPASTSSSTTTATKGKKRSKPEPEPHPSGAGDGEADQEDDDDRPPTSSTTASRGTGAASSARPTSKRPRLDAQSNSQQPSTSSVPAAGQTQAAAAPAPAPARRGFIPRAAADLPTRVNKPPPAFSAALVDPSAAEDGDAGAEPFLFTTNPPTPYAKKVAAQRNAAAGGGQKQQGKGKAPRTAPPARHDSEEDADLSDAAAAPGGPSSTTSRRRRTPPPPSSNRPVAPIHVHETPVQVRNIAFRQGLPPGTPGTIVRTARRSSARGSGKRGSSIGGGFEAVPHPQVADDKLYRSTDASDPIAKRLRSIVSWAAQRTRDRIFRSVREDEMSAAQTAAKRVVDAFIEDVCSLRVDTSVPYQEPSQSQDPARLPPHPHNESNAAKMQELEDSYAAIAREQELRQSLEPTYQTFFDSRTQAHAEASTSYSTLSLPAAARSNPSAYAATLDLSVPAPTSLEEALAIGRRVLSGEMVVSPREGGGKTPAKKGKGKNKAGGEEETPAEVMQRRVAEAQIETAAFRHQTHRLSAFARVAAAYIAHRSSETHAALTRHNELGLAPPAADDQASGGGAGGGEGTTAGLARAVPASAAAAAGSETSSTTTRAAMDPRDLLRAIADSDTKRRR
ncbi:hypothetical protein JCM10908_006510 [Rhodotorula pacifica]|uniref:uncharacterized protein n=1 Tax=Rhodotorula pacifica TaxID=1495444 RepID=UPI0031787BD9